MVTMFIKASVLVAVAVAVVVNVDAAPKPTCLPEYFQFVYDDQLTVVLDHVRNRTGQKYPNEPTRWVWDFNAPEGQNNKFHIKEENGKAVKCVSYKAPKYNTYPRCVPSFASKLGTSWGFMNTDLDYLIYWGQNPSHVQQRILGGKTGGPDRYVIKWTSEIKDKHLLDIPDICDL